MNISGIPDWEKKYEIGITEIDSQHQYFLKLIKRINNNIANKLSEELIRGFLDEIFYYGRFHFCCEENLMKLWKYPDYDAMKKNHDDLMNKISNKITSYRLDKINIEDIISFLVEWFITHTANEDKKLADFLIKNIGTDKLGL